MLAFPGPDPVAFLEHPFRSEDSQTEPNTVAGPRRILTGFRDVPLVSLEAALEQDKRPGGGPQSCDSTSEDDSSRSRDRLRTYRPAPATIPSGSRLRKAVVARNA